MNIRQLFERHYPSLVWYLHRRLGDRDLAKDLAQEAFVRLLDKPPREPDAWLYLVAGNLAHDAQRGELRRSRHLAIVDTRDDYDDHDDGARPQQIRARCRCIRARAAAITMAAIATTTGR